MEDITGHVSNQESEGRRDYMSEKQEQKGKLLVVVDMQNDFIDGVLGTPQAEAIVDKVCQKIEGWDGDVVYTQDCHRPGYEETKEGRKIPEHCIEWTEGWKIRREVYYYFLKREDIEIYRKSRLADTRIARWIYAHGMQWNGGMYEQIEIIGLYTDKCIIANAVVLNFAWPEVRVIVDAECCAGTTQENHEKALDAMEGLLIEVINRKEEKD